MQINSIGKKTNQPTSKAKKYVLIGLIISVILLVILFVLLFLVQNMKPAPAMTLNVDGQAKQFVADTFKFTAENDIYVSLKDVASLIGYRYYDGGYKQTAQNQETCYLESDDEVVVFELGSDKIYKTLNNGQIQYSEFTISAPVIKDDANKLYVIASGLMKGCNVYLSYDSKTNIMSISTLPGLYDTYAGKIKSGEYEKINGATVEGTSELFNNKKTILYGMIIVSSNIKNETKYGVISLDGSQVYLGIKFNSIEFIEASQTFLVSEKDVNGDIKYGVKNKDGKDKIATRYDNIKILDSDNQLYYVDDDGKKGVVDNDGNIVIFAENDQIGINANTFSKDNIKNPMLLYNKYIPVRRDVYWALYDTEGKQISDFNIETFGYISESKSTADNILLIEDIEGIVVKRNGKYGIITTEAIKEKSTIYGVNTVFDSIYSETINGNTTYYLVSGQVETELSGYLESLKNTSNKNSITNKVQQQEIKQIPTQETQDISNTETNQSTNISTTDQENNLYSDEEDDDII